MPFAILFSVSLQPFLVTNDVLLFSDCRHLMGDGLTALNIKELKQLEVRLEKGISRVRSKKVAETILFC